MNSRCSFAAGASAVAGECEGSCWSSLCPADSNSEIQHPVRKMFFCLGCDKSRHSFGSFLSPKTKLKLVNQKSCEGIFASKGIE